MDRRSILASLGRQASFVVVIAAGALGCAGTGPAIVEHPRSPSMMVVSPERDPLAGALTFRAPSGEDPPPTHRTPVHRRVSRAALRPTPRPTLHVAEWSLSLGADESHAPVAPATAFSTALSMSAGPAPHLQHARRAVVVVPIPVVAVEEGAWEQRRTRP